MRQKGDSGCDMLRTSCVVLLFGWLLSGCGGNRPAVSIVPDSPQSASSIPAQTGSPTETLVVPSNLDRDLNDSDTMRVRRNQLVDSFIAPAVSNKQVLEAMRSVARHSFVPTLSLDSAYGDFPMPIGYGQTISQPSLVAMMTDLLKIDKGDKVLEIGTGSGYQAAILRQLTDQVYTVEIIPELTGIARGVLDGLGYKDIKIQRRDGYLGWSEYAPYDAIIVTAAPDHLPPSLVQQLKPDGGRMVIPIGPVGDVQTLWLVTRNGDKVDMQRITDVRFVPLTRQQ
jgi:protein-L-isoaspartate(D-aspartate) O-methyltransferase